MSTSNQTVSESFAIDVPRSEMDRTRRVLRMAAIALAGLFVIVIVVALGVRGRGGYHLFDILVALCPLPLFGAIECALASREKARDRVAAVDLLPDRLVFHSFYADDWSAPYSDIADILVRYRSSYSHFDYMSLQLTMHDGQRFRLGHCRGEVLEELAKALRERCGDRGGETPGTAAKDRAFRLRQRWNMGRKAAVFFLVCGIGLAVRMAFIERESALIRQLEREGVRVEARLTTQHPRKDRVVVLYLFQAPDGSFEKGAAPLPLDPTRRLRQGSTIPVLHLPDDPTVHRGMGIVPSHSLFLRVLGWFGVALSLFVGAACWRGCDAILFRGTFRLLRKNDLAEDWLLRTSPGQ